MTSLQQASVASRCVFELLGEEEMPDESNKKGSLCDGVAVRILASKLDYETENTRHKLQGITVSETLVSIGEVKEIISSLENFPFQRMG